ncbi:MAG: hypothetical protein E6Q62_09700 [Nitrosomonas sp.]|nr:MAG: hypothetical protein E6Q62_09700 [Nitrosomonas sp.]
MHARLIKIRDSIKPDNPTFGRTYYQIKSRLLLFKSSFYFRHLVSVLSHSLLTHLQLLAEELTVVVP